MSTAASAASGAVQKSLLLRAGLCHAGGPGSCHQGEGCHEQVGALHAAALALRRIAAFASLWLELLSHAGGSHTLSCSCFPADCSLCKPWTHMLSHAGGSPTCRGSPAHGGVPAPPTSSLPPWCTTPSGCRPAGCALPLSRRNGVSSWRQATWQAHS